MHLRGINEGGDVVAVAKKGASHKCPWSLEGSDFPLGLLPQDKLPAGGISLPIPIHEFLEVAWPGQCKVVYLPSTLVQKRNEI